MNEGAELLNQVSALERLVREVMDWLTQRLEDAHEEDRDTTDKEDELAHYLEQLFESIVSGLEAYGMVDRLETLRTSWRECQEAGIAYHELRHHDNGGYLHCPAAALLGHTSDALRVTIGRERDRQARERAAREEERNAQDARRQGDREHEITMRNLDELRDQKRRSEDHQRESERRKQDEERERARRAEDEERERKRREEDAAREERRRAEDRQGQRWTSGISAAVAVLASLLSCAGIGVASSDKLAALMHDPQPAPTAEVLEGRLTTSDGSPVPASVVNCLPEVSGVLVAAGTGAYTVTILPTAPRPLRLFCSASATGYAAAPVVVVVAAPGVASTMAIPTLELRSSASASVSTAGASVPLP